MVKTIYIYVSDLATYIGQNKWNISLTFERFWKSADQSSYKNALNKFSETIADNVAQKKEINLKLLELEQNKEIDVVEKVKQEKILVTKSQKIEKEIAKTEQLKDNIVLTEKEKIEKVVGKEILAKITESNADVNLKKEIVKETIEKQDIKLTPKIKQHIESSISKQHGTEFEFDVVKVFEKEYNCKLDISQKSFRYTILHGDTEWIICGKCDGICLEDDFIVEIKNRMHKFFDQVRDYELSQVQMYMLLTGIHEAQLVQRFNRQIRVDNIMYDKDYTDLVLKRLEPFMEFFTNFINETDKQVKYIGMTEKQKETFLKKNFISKALKIN